MLRPRQALRLNGDGTEEARARDAFFARPLERGLCRREAARCAVPFSVWGSDTGTMDGGSVARGRRHKEYWPTGRCLPVMATEV
jgi:hypothetical protein